MFFHDLNELKQVTGGSRIRRRLGAGLRSRRHVLVSATLWPSAAAPARPAASEGLSS